MDGFTKLYYNINLTVLVFDKIKRFIVYVGQGSRWTLLVDYCFGTSLLLKRVKNTNRRIFYRKR